MLAKISPCLWFNNQAEEAARFYTGIFPNSRIVSISYYGATGETLQQPKDKVLLVVFELQGQTFTALNGGTPYPHTPAISFNIDCATQAEIDYYWEKLSEGGDPAAQICGWWRISSACRGKSRRRLCTRCTPGRIKRGKIAPWQRSCR